MENHRGLTRNRIDESLSTPVAEPRLPEAGDSNAPVSSPPVCGRSERGLALVTALLMLSFLSIVGAALLGATTLDLRITDNYRSNSQAAFLARAGIEAGRLALSLSPGSPAPDLIVAAGGGPGPTLATQVDLTTLLATDDRPLIPAAPAQRAAGQIVNDALGSPAGAYHVWLRNDAQDGQASVVDRNNVVTLLSIGRIGSATRTLEAVVHRPDLPALPTPLTLDGGIASFREAISGNFSVAGFDSAGVEAARHAVGVISPEDHAAVKAQFMGPPDRSHRYVGAGGTADVQDVEAVLDPRLRSVRGLEAMIAALTRAATDVYYPSPNWNDSVNLGGMGGPADFRVVVVEGDATIGPVSGYGILVVRGNLTLSGEANWYGIILVVGQGRLEFAGGGNGRIRGAILVAKTRDTGSRSNSRPLGDLLTSRGDVYVDLAGGGSPGVAYDSNAVNGSLGNVAFVPIAFREF